MPTSTYKKLTQAEKEIQVLLERNRSNWRAVAKIAIAVREDQLFKQSGMSFSAWVKLMAERCDCQRSLIWRYIKAGQYYLQTVGSNNIKQIDSALAAPEALVNLEKVERHAPEPVFQSLKEKVLDGEATVRECRILAKQYKPESENRRGRPPLGAEGTYEHLGRQGGRQGGQQAGRAQEKQDSTPIGIGTPEMPSGLVAQRIAQILHISLVDWTKYCSGMRYPPRHHTAHTEVRVNFEKKRLRLDFLGVIRWSNKSPKDVFGVEIKSSLADFEQDQKWPLYLQFCDYFCFALPASEEELIEAVHQVDSEVGILAIDIVSDTLSNTAPVNTHSTEVEVVRTPKKLQGGNKYLLYETLYERALGWSGSEQSNS